MPEQRTEALPQLILDEPRVLTQGRRLLILFAALSYTFFFIDVYLGHYLWVQLFVKRFELSFSLIPHFFSPIGLAVGIWAGLSLTPRSVTTFKVVMLASILVGLLGTYFHAVPRFTTSVDLLAVSTWLGDPPLLAPAAFALPGIMGIVATYGLSWHPAVSTEEPRPREAPGLPSTGVEELARGSMAP